MRLVLASLHSIALTSRRSSDTNLLLDLRTLARRSLGLETGQLLTRNRSSHCSGTKNVESSGTTVADATHGNLDTCRRLSQSNILSAARNSVNVNTVNEDLDAGAARLAVPSNLKTVAIIVNDPSLNRIGDTVNVNIVDLFAAACLSTVIVGNNHVANAGFACLNDNRSRASLNQLGVVGLRYTSSAGTLSAAFSVRTTCNLVASSSLTSSFAMRRTSVDKDAITSSVRGRVPRNGDFTRD
jgi:hypothetical protein